MAVPAGSRALGLPGMVFCVAYAAAVAAALWCAFAAHEPVVAAVAAPLLVALAAGAWAAAEAHRTLLRAQLRQQKALDRLESSETLLGGLISPLQERTLRRRR